jgi:8-oxo-dGTP pyrophosphatase MutT (NUDIX family)
MVQMKNDKKIVSFDFDNTIAVTYIDMSDEDDLKPVFLEYNNHIISKIQNHISAGDDVFIVTSRFRNLEELYPTHDVPYHLEQLGLKDYFWPNRVFYMNGGLKTDKLKELGVDLHHDDSMEEVLACKEANIPVKNPYDYYPDAKIVGKSVIYDANDKILLLKRGDEGQKWDLPGGHVKEIEIKRGAFGLVGGLEREIAEETGLILPNEQFYYDFPNTYKDRTNQIHVYLSKLEESEPEIDLNVQDFQENIAYEWVEIQDLHNYKSPATSVLVQVIEKLTSEGRKVTNEEKYLMSQQKNWKNMKKKLIGLGKNKHTGGGKGHTRPKMTKGKAAPPDFAVLEEEESKKKATIKIKVIKNEENLDEKKKKRRKKRKKKKKTRKSASYYPYYDVYDSGAGGDGGDGGGE